jgi:thiol-disulfide isomerase/thioredoxin
VKLPNSVVLKCILFLSFPTLKITVGNSQQSVVNKIDLTNPIQYISTKIEPLKIGDKVPDIPFKLFFSSTTSKKLTDFKNKLVILDFWATWCSSCFSKWPELDSLQNAYNDKLQIVLVNSQSSGDEMADILEFFKKRKNHPNLLLAVQDTIAGNLFPHLAVPHYVWIGPDMRVKAITYSEELTPSNIEAAFNSDNNIPVPIKKDFFPDQLIDFPITKMLIDESFQGYTLFKKGKIEDLVPINFSRLQEIEKGKHKYPTFIERGRAMINLPLLEMYKSAIIYNKSFFSHYTDKRFIIDMADSTELFYNSTALPKAAWEQQNLFNYDLVVPSSDINNLYSIIINDLNKYSGYYGRIEKRKIKCLALVLNGNGNNMRTAGGYSEYSTDDILHKTIVRNTSLNELIRRIELANKSFKFPIVNETKYKFNVDLDLEGDIENSSDLKRSLSKYGLDLIGVERPIDVFVISKSPKKLSLNSSHQ